MATSGVSWYDEGGEDVDEQGFFAEADEVVENINCFSNERGQHEISAERIAQVLDRYQEQPSILDHKLEDMVVPLLKVVQAVAAGIRTESVLPYACRIMYTLCKVRGYKTVVKFVPHEVADLEPLVRLLATYDPGDHASWQIAYTIMVWLSMVVMVPFDLSIIDSSSLMPGGAGRSIGCTGLIESIESIAISYLDSTGPARDAASTLLARLLTRPGLQRRLSTFIRWGGATLEAARRNGDISSIPSARATSSGISIVEGESALVAPLGPHEPSLPTDTKSAFLVVGIYAALAHIFKLGHRAELLPQLPLLSCLNLNPAAQLNDPSVTRRKLGMKLLQRVAAVHLPPRVASWRYQRGSRSLEDNLQLSARAVRIAVDCACSTEVTHMTETDSSCVEASRVEVDSKRNTTGEVPGAIEEILEQLLYGLRDADTVVRWSAAKGIGRVTARLSLDLADDIVESVLALLSKDEGANAWHGACLALAELSRRGLLLPIRLSEVLPLLVLALHYDVARGATSVGTHVRDAACYVCWAFARAFEPSVMAPHVDQLARSLLIVIVYDREVNCRRAASAAFQENVGRQGNFPHGIEIVTRADYFSVGSRPRSYLEIAAYLGSFDEYRIPLFHHLSTTKYRHWDIGIRLLAAQAAARLAPLDEAYAFGSALPSLTGKSLSPDLKTRHGATHMIAEMLFGLVNSLYNGDGQCLQPGIRKSIANLVPDIEKARLYRGRGGEIMRGATSRLLEIQALLRMPCSTKVLLKVLATLDDSIKHPSEAISRAGVAAIKAVAASYFCARSSTGKQEDFVRRYVIPLSTDHNAALRRGFVLALGALPAVQLLVALPEAMEALIAASQLDDNKDAQDPETRRNAIRSLLHVTTTVSLAAHAPLNVSEHCSETAGSRTPSSRMRGEVIPASAASDRCWDDSSCARGMSTALYVAAVEAMLAALCDYQTDNRGDVGSWVREAAIGSLLPMLVLAVAPTSARTTSSAAPVVVSTTEFTELVELLPGLCLRFVTGLARLANEKIDRLREYAALSLAQFLRHPQFCSVPSSKELSNVLSCGTRTAVSQTQARSITCSQCATPYDRLDVCMPDYLAPHTCFPRTAKFLSLPAYRKAALHGIAISAGGVTESTTKAAVSALLAHVVNISKEDRITFASDLISLLLDTADVARVHVPLMRTLQCLLEAHVLESIMTDITYTGIFDSCAHIAESASTFAAQFIGCVRPSLRSKDISTLFLAAQLLTLLMPHVPSQMRNSVLRALLVLLVHRFPKVRKTTADQLYVHFITYGDNGLSPTLPAMAPVQNSTALVKDPCIEIGEKALACGSAHAGGCAESDMAPGGARMDAVMALLLETPWLDGLAHARHSCGRILEIMGLPPLHNSGYTPPAAQTTPGEEDTYKQLFKEMGY